VSIYDLQYATEIGSNCYDSPYYGQEIWTTGVVGFVSSSMYPKFYIQDGDGSFHGVSLFDYSINPTVGSEVLLKAEVDEYYGQTELQNINDFIVLSTGNTPWGPTIVPTGDLAGGCSFSGEQWEGMLVKVENVICTRRKNPYGEWYVSDGTGEVQINDHFYTYPHDPIIGKYFDYIIGFVDYIYNEYEILPRFLKDISQLVAIELAGFEAVAGDGYVTLNWRTAAEVETHSFNIYRNEEVIATVDAFGDAHDYMYVDRQVTNGQTYTYRLSDVDLSGVETIHPMTCSVTPSAMPTDYVSATVLSFRKTGN
jgi:hypothetical protein